jgi:hypothetical protein
LVLAASLLLGTGCGGQPVLEPAGVEQTGRLTKGGKPLEVAPVVGMVELSFYLADGSSPDPQGAEVRPDGTFVLKGTTGRGVQPGKYKVVVVWNKDGMGDALNGAFSLEKTTIVREVKEPPVEIVIELDRPNG